MTNFLTTCCEAKVYRKEKLHYCCSKCNTDVTLYVFFYETAKEQDNIDSTWDKGKSI